VRLGAHVGVTDTGRRRRRNEDAYVNNPPLFAVADGMGGAQAGEVASRIAAESLRESEVAGAGVERVVELIQAANRRVYDRSTADEAASGMGTTVTVALVGDDVVSFGHVGDSRAYLVREGRLEQLTQDHSLVSELLRSGKISPEEAESHPQRSVITRALGTDPDVDVDAFSIEAAPGDVFLLCSDGLTTMVRDDAIEQIVEDHRGNLRGAAEILIDAANRGGGEDNITVVVFELVADGDGDATQTLPVEDPPTHEQALDEDTLTELDKVPAVDTAVIPVEAIRGDQPSSGRLGQILVFLLLAAVAAGIVVAIVVALLYLGD
jgi:serine/threonine protein phosphatase PrpC